MYNFSPPQEHDPVEADESRQPRHFDQLVSQPGEDRHQHTIIIFISNITIITIIILETCAGQAGYERLHQRSSGLFLLESSCHLFHRTHHRNGLHFSICYR